MKTIIFKELKELTREGRFKIAISISLVLLVIATITSINQYKKNNEQYVASKAKERTIWETQGEKNPHSAAHYGTYAFKPKFALSLFDYGVTKYTGNTVFLEAHKRNEAAFNEASDQTSLARFGTLSINFVLIYLFPLIIILIGYNAYTKEIEHKTFTLLKSQGVSPIKLALGKWIAMYIPVFILTLIVFLITGIVLSNIENLAFFSWNSLLVLLGIYLLYYLIITTITVLISMWSKSSGMALVSSLIVWIVFSFITPKIATNFANTSHPYPSKSEFNSLIAKDKKNGLDGHNPWNEAAKKLKEATLKEYGVDSISQLPFNYDGYRMQKGEEHEAKIYEKHYNILNTIAIKQNNTYKKLSFISPFIPARFLSMDIANTSDNLHWKFTKAAEKYRIETQKFLNYDFKDNSKTGDWSYKMSADKFKELPTFEFVPPTLSQIIKENTQNLLFLLLWFLIPFIGLISSSKKI
ncbi:ABC-2 type transport system permease protein [Tenacibaculum sp. 190524A02b]|uniref:ABC-2 type transport system permease protein n=1 Tax=Tenacibaculum vairaonense TaxID=3137860 RepID=A0ABM9PRC6_9FLAO